MSIYIPFNHNPASRDIKTAAYTIPAGNYARVNFLAYDTDCTLDSDVVIPQLSISDTQSVSADNTNIYSPPAGYHFKGRVSFFGSGGTVNTAGEGWRFGIRVSSTDYWSFSSILDSGTTYTYSNMASATDSSSALFDGSTSSHGHFEIDIPSGTSLSYDMVGSHTSIILVAGMLQQPIGASSEFWVESGVEVDGSKFEVTLYNVA